jgi:hypothetical protein
MMTVQRLRELNAQGWADFKKHWPMVVLGLLVEMAGGFLFGVALSLATFVYLLEHLT